MSYYKILNIVFINILTDETTRALLSVFDTKRARHVWLFAVALDRHIPLFVEFRVGPAKVLLVRICVGATLITAYCFSTCAFQNNSVNRMFESTWSIQLEQFKQNINLKNY